jgi:kinesin family protein C1
LSSSKRVFASNGANEHSSRSHHVFQIRIRGQNKAFQDVESLLNIVDLAGSERRFESTTTANANPNAQSTTTDMKRNASKNAKLNTSTSQVPTFLKKEAVQPMNTMKQIPHRENKNE